MFSPKLWDTLKGYSRQQFIKDIMAGVIVGVVALPLAIAFAIASGRRKKGCIQPLSRDLLFPL
ncbi:MAG TPA: SulP family inorganic anion transporter [Agriterribacter sp.]|nr:SulP family inorganic anion transporter [Agriterribacter sp.]